MPADSKAHQTAAAKGAERNGAQREASAEHADVTARGVGAQPALTAGSLLPSTFRELGSAIFSTANPVKAGAELLDPGDKKADPTRLNALKTFAEWVFGKPGGEPHRRPPRIIWDLPCPPYEPVDPVEPQDLEGDDQ